MGLLDSFRNLWAPQEVSYGTVTLWGTPTTFADVAGLIKDQDPSQLFRQQPNLRTLISFLARNTAQLGVHTFERVSDVDRKRNTTDRAAQLLKRPNKTMTGYDLIYRLVADLALWDEALWLVTQDIEAPTGWTIQPVPMKWVRSFGGGDLWGPDHVWIQPPGTKAPTKVPMEDVLHFHGWDPDNLHAGVTPVEALKAEISEQIHAKVYREQQWTKAGRAGLVVTRPAEAPKWTPDQKRKFKEVLDEKLSSSGADAGNSLIFEDGMKGERLGFNAKENQFVEAAKLSFTVCCQVYHVNPTMVGMLDNANFSNVKEFRRMLYGETLGPTLVQLEDKLNAFLMPKIAEKTNLYYEFNVKEKLRGSFEEEGQILQAATGGPYMTRNEARSRNNLSHIEGGDELIVPLNVLVGGQASPSDATPNSITGEAPSAGGGGGTSAAEAPAAAALVNGFTPDEINKLISAASTLIRSGFDPMAALAAVGLDPIEHLGLLPVTVQKPVDESGAVDEEIQDALKSAQEVHLKRHHRKARASDTVESNTEKALRSFYKRQGAAVLSALGAKSDEWWDEERWNRELAQDLYKVAVQVANAVGRKTAEELGFDPGSYDQDRTLKFLQAVSESRAAAINGATKSALDEVLARSDEEDPPKPADVFKDAEEVRSVAGAAALVTCFSAFATTEAAKQLSTGENQATKTWIVNSKSPRKAHARMDGETVPVDQKFSNGADWPGDPVLGADGVAGCRCSVQVTMSS